MSVVPTWAIRAPLEILSLTKKNNLNELINSKTILLEFKWKTSQDRQAVYFRSWPRKNMEELPAQESVKWQQAATYHGKRAS